MSKENQLVYGLLEDHIEKAFGSKTFDLSIDMSLKDFGEVPDHLDFGLVGIGRNHAHLFPNVAPLVTYGITVKVFDEEHIAAVKNCPTERLSPAARELVGFPENPLVALYKQRKVDAKGKEYFILSIGISGEVYSGDLHQKLLAVPTPSNCNCVCLTSTLEHAAFRNYITLVTLESTEYDIVQENIGGMEQDLITNNPTIGRFYFRDGVKKTGYTAGAHIAAVYSVVCPIDTNLNFEDPNYEYLGWFSFKYLQHLAQAQHAMHDLGNFGTHELLFGQKEMQLSMGEFANVPLEPWSLGILMDMNCNFEDLVTR